MQCSRTTSFVCSLWARGQDRNHPRKDVFKVLQFSHEIAGTGGQLRYVPSEELAAQAHDP